MCLYTNLDGLNSKTAELDVILDKEDLNLAFLTETKCNPEMLNTNLFNMTFYTVVRMDRNSQIASGGGVAILIKKHFVVDELSVSNLVDHEAQECVWCGVRNGWGKDLVLGIIYRTPSSAEENNDLICDLLRLSENSTRGQTVTCVWGF